MEERKLIKVKDHLGICRDSISRAIVNTDTKAYQEAKARQKRAKEKQERIDTLENTVEGIKKDLEDIKKLLIEALKK